MASSPRAPGTALPVSEHKPAPSAPQGLLPSPPPTRDPSIASGSHEPERAGDGPSSGTAPPDGEADITDSGLHEDAGTHAGAAHARAPLPDRTSLRVSTPWLDMGSDDGASPQPADGEGSPDALEFRHSLALGDSDGMAESPAEEAVLDIRAPGAPAQAGPSRLPAPTHPLRAPVPAAGAPRRGSLQPWELLEPPADNNTGRGRGGTVSSAGTHGPFATLRSQRSRPLVPKSSYYFGPPPPGSAFGSDPAGTVGLHHPREVLRIERDYTGGETIQFVNVYPLELEGRITPTQFLETMNTVNEILVSAHSLGHACFDNAFEILSLQISRLFWTSHYEKQMRRLRRTIETVNAELFNPAGLNILWPRDSAFLFMEIEYY